MDNEGFNNLSDDVNHVKGSSNVGSENSVSRALLDHFAEKMQEAENFEKQIELMKSQQYEKGVENDKKFFKQLLDKNPDNANLKSLQQSVTKKRIFDITRTADNNFEKWEPPTKRLSISSSRTDSIFTNRSLDDLTGNAFKVPAVPLDTSIDLESAPFTNVLVRQPVLQPIFDPKMCPSSMTIADDGITTNLALQRKSRRSVRRTISQFSATLSDFEEAVMEPDNCLTYDDICYIDSKCSKRFEGFVGMSVTKESNFVSYEEAEKSINEKESAWEKFVERRKIGKLIRSGGKKGKPSDRTNKSPKKFKGQIANREEVTESDKDFIAKPKFMKAVKDVCETFGVKSEKKTIEEFVKGHEKLFDANMARSDPNKVMKGRLASRARLILDKKDIPSALDATLDVLQHSLIDDLTDYRIGACVIEVLRSPEGKISFFQKRFGSKDIYVPIQLEHIIALGKRELVSQMEGSTMEICFGLNMCVNTNNDASSLPPTFFEYENYVAIYMVPPRSLKKDMKYLSNIITTAPKNPVCFAIEYYNRAINDDRRPFCQICNTFVEKYQHNSLHKAALQVSSFYYVAVETEQNGRVLTSHLEYVLKQSSTYKKQFKIRNLKEHMKAIDSIYNAFHLVSTIENYVGIIFVAANDSSLTPTVFTDYVAYFPSRKGFMTVTKKTETVKMKTYVYSNYVKVHVTDLWDLLVEYLESAELSAVFMI